MWKKFKRNKLGVTALVVITLCFFICIFGYIVAPDNTVNADLQCVEVQAKSPGYKQLFLLLDVEEHQSASILEKLFFGQPTLKKPIPINNYTIKENQLIVEKYVDEGSSAIETYNINEITNQHPNKIKEHLVVKTFWLGTDGFGRDILSRIIIGTRVSLSVGFIAVVIALLIGVILGALAGYYRGWIDEVIMWFVTVMWSIPTLLLVFAITMLMGKGFWQIFIAIGLTMWVSVARLVRGEVMSLKNREFVQAAGIMGFSDFRIILKHILPNITGPIIVSATNIFASAILVEAGLSFLGIGVQAPMPSWGLMVKENYTFLITSKPFLALIPGIAIMILVFAFNILGNALRDITDVKLE